VRAGQQYGTSGFEGGPWVDEGGARGGLVNVMLSKAMLVALRFGRKSGDMFEGMSCLKSSVPRTQSFEDRRLFPRAGSGSKTDKSLSPCPFGNADKNDKRETETLRSKYLPGPWHPCFLQRIRNNFNQSMTVVA
jgi:hypothetical protein